MRNVSDSSILFLLYVYYMFVSVHVHICYWHIIFWDEPVKQNIYDYLHCNFSFYFYCFVLVLDIAAEGKYFLLVNICGQNIDTPTFYSGLLDSIQEIDSTQHIPLVGDFNLIQNKILDSKIMYIVITLNLDLKHINW